jgi:uncharacterized protein YdaU (DUF1376 family)
MHLTAQEHGAYLLAIMHYWTTGPLPDDDKKLAAICRIDRSEWPSVRDTLAPLFQIEGGQWRHKRIEAELLRAKEKSEKAARNAKVRWERGQDAEPMRNGCETDADASVQHMLAGCSTTTTSSSELSETYLANNNTESAREKIHALALDIEAVVVAPPEFAFGLPSAVEMMFREGHTELEIMDAARVIAAQGKPIKNPRYLVTTVRNRKADAARQTPSPRKPRYNPADASSPDAVAERRAALARGMRAILPAGDAGDGTAGG